MHVQQSAESDGKTDYCWGDAKVSKRIFTRRTCMFGYTYRSTASKCQKKANLSHPCFLSRRLNIYFTLYRPMQSTDNRSTIPQILIWPYRRSRFRVWSPLTCQNPRRQCIRPTGANWILIVWRLAFAAQDNTHMAPSWKPDDYYNTSLT